jgi:phage terminase large subunit
MKTQIPEPLGFLLEPARIGQPGRYKVVKGGRGAGKSENFAQALVILGVMESSLILCTREVQNSIKDSVHSMIKQWIIRLELQDFYTVTDRSIKGRNGTEFLFWGLGNIDSLKSIARVRYCWVEEAQSVTKKSWDKLIPSIRWEDKERGLVSEIWISYNPELVTDDTHKRFAVDPPSTAKVVTMNWRDNPWFPEVLRVEMEDCKKRSEEDYLHIWEGECVSNVKGAIYATELKAATNEGRIGNVPYNRRYPVDTVWDLGFSEGGDPTAIWFVQAYDGMFHFIDCLEERGQDVPYFLIELQRRQYLYGIAWVPFDAVDNIIHRRAVRGNADASVEMQLRNGGQTVRMVQKVTIVNRINAGRTIFPLCRFDEHKCADGIQALRHFQWGEINENGVHKREPVHNWASHYAEAFTRAGQALKLPRKEPQKKASPLEQYPVRHTSVYAPFG